MLKIDVETIEKLNKLNSEINEFIVFAEKNVGLMEPWNIETLHKLSDGAVGIYGMRVGIEQSLGLRPKPLIIEDAEIGVCGGDHGEEAIAYLHTEAIDLEGLRSLRQWSDEVIRWAEKRTI